MKPKLDAGDRDTFRYDQYLAGIAHEIGHRMNTYVSSFPLTHPLVRLHLPTGADILAQDQRI